MCLISLQYWLSQIFIWTALGDVDLHFSLILVTKANPVEQGITSAASLYHRCNQSMHVTDGMAVLSLAVSIQHKIYAARDCLFQILLNWKLSHIVYMPDCVKLKILNTFEKWFKFSSYVQAKSYKKKSRKMRPACTDRKVCWKRKTTNTLLLDMAMQEACYFLLKPWSNPLDVLKQSI